jgi:hypothetical protein
LLCYADNMVTWYFGSWNLGPCFDFVCHLSREMLKSANSNTILKPLLRFIKPPVIKFLLLKRNNYYLTSHFIELGYF